LIEHAWAQQETLSFDAPWRMKFAIIYVNVRAGSLACADFVASWLLPATRRILCSSDKKLDLFTSCSNMMFRCNISQPDILTPPLFGTSLIGNAALASDFTYLLGVATQVVAPRILACTVNMHTLHSNDCRIV
jgi:hypothetical protein